MNPNKTRLKAVAITGKQENRTVSMRLAYTQEHAALMNKIREANEQIQIHNQNIQVWGTRAIELKGSLATLDALEPQALPEITEPVTETTSA